MGRFGFTDHTARRTSFRKLGGPGRGCCGWRRPGRAARPAVWPQKSLDHHGPIDGGRGFLVHAIVALVPDYADDFAPRRFGVLADLLAQARRRDRATIRAPGSRKPEPPGAFRRYRSRSVAAGQQGVAHGLEKAGRDELVAPQSRYLPFARKSCPRRRSGSLSLLPSMVMELVRPTACDARNRRNFLQNVVIGADDLLGLRRLRIWNGDVQREDLRRDR